MMPETYKTITRNDIGQMDRLSRLTLINSISGFKSVNLIGTADRSGKHNVAIFSSVVHIGSDPPLLGMITRPPVVERHTLENIESTGYYTINHVNASILDRAHQTSAKYARQVSEFAATGLTPEMIGDFHAPFVGESNVKLALKFVERSDIKVNGTILIIGEIEFMVVPDSALHRDGAVDLISAGTIAMSGLDTYHQPVEFAKKEYARPDR